jgi:FkbM family methyltransferase
MFIAVVLNNEYGLPEGFASDDVIVDCGAHTGTFSWACLVRGAGCVHAYEVDEENFALLRTNLAPFNGRVSVEHAAVWRSDDDDPHLMYQRCVNPMNTGGGGVMGALTGTPVGLVVPFDTVVTAAALRASGRVRLVKLDVEGSEFPILYTATTLDLVDEFVGEYHLQPDSRGRFPDLPPFTCEELVARMERDGFTVTTSVTDPGHLGLFRAQRSVLAR